MNNNDTLIKVRTLIPKTEHEDFLKLKFGNQFNDIRNHIYFFGSNQIKEYRHSDWVCAVTAWGRPFMFPLLETEIVTFTHNFTEKTSTLPVCLAGLISTGQGVYRSLIKKLDHIKPHYRDELAAMTMEIKEDETTMAEALGCLDEYLSIM